MVSHVSNSQFVVLRMEQLLLDDSMSFEDDDNEDDKRMLVKQDRVLLGS